MYLSRNLMGRNRLITSTTPSAPNPKCYVCSPQPTITVRTNIDSTTVGYVVETILKKALGMIAPDATIDDGKGE